MAISGDRMFSMLKKLGFIRLSTYEGEKKGAAIIADEVKSITGKDAVIEPFMAPQYEIKKVKFEITAPFAETIEATGYGFSGNTAPEGLEAEMVYMEGFDEIDLARIRGKIVFFTGGIGYANFEKLCKAGPVGFVCTCGTFLDRDEDTDMEMRMLRSKHLEYGKIPGVVIKMKDALKLIPRHPTRARITLEQVEGEAESQNVIYEVKGTEFPEEVVVYTAHYDSVEYSEGYFDNASGSVMLLEMLRHYTENTPKRTVRFIWCGSEERGLLGSKAYIAGHEADLDAIRLCINIDMAGPILGKDAAVITGEESLCHAISFLYKELGHSMSVEQNTYSSDSIPFADKGIPGVNFMRRAAGGSSLIHCRHDVIDILSGESLEYTTNFVREFSDRVVNACFFPIPKKMPDNMVDKIDKYLLKKK